MTLDIFKNDKFSLTSLTASINEMPYVPGQAGRLGIFDEAGEYTTTIEVENESGTLILVPNQERGAPALQVTRDPRYVRYFKVPHKPLAARIYADEIQNKRKFGSDSDLETAESVLNRRMEKMVKSLDATVEYGRIGAIKGIIYDADGSTVYYNLFTEFGVNQKTVDFAFGTDTTDIVGKCTEVREHMQEQLGGEGGDDLQVVCFCGATWFKRFVSHPKVTAAYLQYKAVQEAIDPIRSDVRYKGFKFGDITFYVYRGRVGDVNFVAASEAHFFAVGIPGLFITRYAPADYVDTANTEGLARYASIAWDPLHKKFVEVETQTNPISLCTRPATLVKGITNN